MSHKYAFGWNKDAAVECPKLDEFRAELDALLKRYGVGFDVESYGDGGGYVTLCAYDGEPDFFRHLEDYYGSVPWLDEAKARYTAESDRLHQESKRQDEAKRAVQERELYERLRAKYEARK